MRVIERKRPPFMTKKKWFVVISIIILIIALIIVLAYRNIYADLWDQEKVVFSVIEESNYYVINDEVQLSKYVWDQRYWLLLAENHEGQKMYSVWKDDSYLDEIAYDEVLSKEQMLAKIKRDKPAVQDVSAQPAYLYGRFAWEVQYIDPTSDHLKLAFYYMSDGHFIDEYTIPKETRP